MRVPSSDGVELEVLDLGGDGPPVLIAHANGFCGGAYLPVARALGEHHRVWAVDLRAHGASSTPASGDLTWQGMIDDVLAVVEALEVGPMHGLGHSLGGACLLGAEARRPGTVANAYVFEPIVIPPHWGDSTPRGNPLAEAARRRRASFASKAEALSRYASRPPLGLLRADALAAYVEYGFVELPDGSVTLACTPEDEAKAFEAPGKPTFEDVAAVDIDVMVGHGMREPFGPQAFAPDVAKALTRGSAQAYDHLGHFGPLEDPTTIAADAARHFATFEAR
jgi:pimeloyl-ACP methyl ester carboxylesterase